MKMEDEYYNLNIMNPMNVLDDINEKLWEFRDRRINYFDRDKVIVGILFADARESNKLSFMEIYINSYDEKSGYQFDFFIPEYVVRSDGRDKKSPNSHIFYDSSLNDPVFHMKKTGQDYSFQDKNYDDSVKEFCKKLSIKKQRLGKENSVLFLIEININSGEFMKYIIIEMRAEEDEKYTQDCLKKYLANQ